MKTNLFLISLLIVILTSACNKENDFLQTKNHYEHNNLRLNDSTYSIDYQENFNSNSPYYNYFLESYGYTSLNNEYFGELIWDDAIITTYVSSDTASIDKCSRLRLVSIPFEKVYNENGMAFVRTYYTLFNIDSLNFLTWIEEYSTKSEIMEIIDRGNITETNIEDSLSPFTGSIKMLTSDNEFTLVKSIFESNELVENSINFDIDNPEWLMRPNGCFEACFEWAHNNCINSWPCWLYYAMCPECGWLAFAIYCLIDCW